MVESSPTNNFLKHPIVGAIGLAGSVVSVALWVQTHSSFFLGMGAMALMGLVAYSIARQVSGPVEGDGVIRLDVEPAPNERASSSIELHVDRHIERPGAVGILTSDLQPLTRAGRGAEKEASTTPPKVDHLLRIEYSPEEPNISEYQVDGESFRAIRLKVETPFLAGDLSVKLELHQTKEWGGEFPDYGVVDNPLEVIKADKDQPHRYVEIIRQSLRTRNVLFGLPVTLKHEKCGRAIWCKFTIENSANKLVVRGGVEFWLVADAGTRLIQVHNRPSPLQF